MKYLIGLNLITLFLLLYLAKRYLDTRYSHRTFKRLIDHINVGYYRYRARDGVVLAVNKGFVDILELKIAPGDVIGRSLSELIIYVEGEGSIREQLKKRGELRKHEYHFKTLGGKDKWVLHNSYLTKEKINGEEIIEALVEDITEERMSYEKMKVSQERYEKLFRNSGDMVLLCGMDDMTIDEVNPVTEAITGFSEEELIGRTLGSMIHPSRRKKVEDCRKDLFYQGTARLDTVIVCKNGSYKQVICTLTAVELHDKKIIMAVVKDVSALVREKEEEARRKKELEDFWRSSVRREERIKDLRIELERAQQQIKLLKRKYEPGKK